MKKIVSLLFIISLSSLTLLISGCSTPPTGNKVIVKTIPIPADVAPDKVQKQQEPDDFLDEESDKKLTCQQSFSKCMDECKDIEGSDDGSVDWEKKMCVGKCKVNYQFCSVIDFF